MLNANTIGLNNARQALRIGLTLHRAGFVVVHSPGARNTTMLRALECTQTEIHTVVDERAAAFLALGLARSGRAVALLATSGSACAHYLPALLEARHACVPILVLSADRPGHLQGVRAPQTTDQQRIAMAACNTTASLPDLAQASNEILQRHWDRMLSALRHQQPAWWNLGIDEPFWPDQALPDTPQPLAMNAPALPPAPPPAGLPEVLPGRGLLVCGSNLERHQDLPALANNLTELARRTGWPIVLDGGSCLQPLLGTSDTISLQDRLVRGGLVDEFCPELVVRTGGATTSKAFEHWLTASPQITIAPFEPCNPAAAKSTWIPYSSIRGLQQLPVHTEVDPEWKSAWLNLQHSCIQNLPSDTARRVWLHLAREIPTDSILHLGNSTVIRDFEVHGNALQGSLAGLYANRGLNGIDGQVATATGLAFGLQHAVVAVLGDVTTQHDATSLALAASSPYPVHLYVINNGGGRIFDRLPGLQNLDSYEQRYRTRPVWDWQRTAQACGLAYRRISLETTQSEHEPLLTQSSLTELVAA